MKNRNGLRQRLTAAALALTTAVGLSASTTGCSHMTQNERIVASTAEIVLGTSLCVLGGVASASLSKKGHGLFDKHPDDGALLPPVLLGPACAGLAGHGTYKLVKSINGGEAEPTAADKTAELSSCVQRDMREKEAAIGERRAPKPLPSACCALAQGTVYKFTCEPKSVVAQNDRSPM